MERSITIASLNKFNSLLAALESGIAADNIDAWDDLLPICVITGKIRHASNDYDYYIG